MCSQRHFIFWKMCFSFFSVCSPYHRQHILEIQSFSLCIYCNVIYQWHCVRYSVLQARPSAQMWCTCRATAKPSEDQHKVREMLPPTVLCLAQIIFPIITTNSCFRGRQSRNSIHSLSLPSHSPPACLIGDTAAMKNSLSLMSCPL